jgi:hypothetical protein
LPARFEAGRNAKSTPSAKSQQPAQIEQIRIVVARMAKHINASTTKPSLLCRPAGLNFC